MGGVSNLFGSTVIAAGYPRFQAFVRTRWFGLTAALLSLTVLSGYVFLWAPYTEFVFSDMAKYWDSAIARLQGGEFDEGQYVAWPPLYHIFLAELFRVLSWLGLSALVRLETALFINIMAFAISVYALQRVAGQWFARSEMILVTVLLYALGFPSLYFNAFLLSGNLGMPLMICAFALVVHRQQWWAAAVGGLVLALGVIVRPSFGPYGLAFVLLYLARHGFSRQFLGRAALFSGAFFAAVLLASAEVARISGGKVFGLSSNGGLDFFITMSNYHRIETAYDGWHFVVVAPALSWEPENGTFYTDVPFYNQGYYFRQGWEFLKRDPMRLFRSYEHMSHLFFADMLPTRLDAPGFSFWIPLWDWFKFGMFLTFGLYAWLWRRLGARKPEFVLMISVVALTLIVSAIFTGEPRYTYSILFIFYLLFFKLVELFWQDRARGWLRRGLIYACVLASITLVIAAATEIRRRDLGPRSVQISLPPPDVTESPSQLEVRRVRFPFGKDKEGLFHVSEDLPQLKQPGLVRMQTRMEVLGTQTRALQFEIYSAWLFRIYVDGKPLVSAVNADFFEPMQAYIELTPGVHHIEIHLDYEPTTGGFAVNYSYWEPNGWRVRRFLGVATDMVRFSLPDAPTIGPTAQAR